MSAINATGAIYNDRQGSIPVRHTLVISANTSTTAKHWLTVQASPSNPVLLEAKACVSTVDGGGSPTLSLGYTASTYTDLLSTVSTATAATGGTFLPANNVIGQKRIDADTAIYYKQGGTPDGAGVTTIFLTVTTINTESE